MGKLKSHRRKSTTTRKEEVANVSHNNEDAVVVDVVGYNKTDDEQHSKVFRETAATAATTSRQSTMRRHDTSHNNVSNTSSSTLDLSGSVVPRYVTNTYRNMTIKMDTSAPISTILDGIFGDADDGGSNKVPIGGADSAAPKPHLPVVCYREVENEDDGRDDDDEYIMTQNLVK
jgi:hypothetical protein